MPWREDLAAFGDLLVALAGRLGGLRKLSA
jgi:hypothetical protein